MKRIYILGFRGKGIRDHRFDNEPLISAGHVGIAFEGYDGSIIGFHPTDKAIRDAGGIEKAIAKLLDHESGDDTLEGQLYEDYAIFARANELAEQRFDLRERNTTVFQYTIECTDEEFERIRKLVMQWYNEETKFTYAFPSDPLRENRNNCATFLQTAGIPKLDGNGDTTEYVPILKEQKTVWTPRGTRNATERDLE